MDSQPDAILTDLIQQVIGVGSWSQVTFPGTAVLFQRSWEGNTVVLQWSRMGERGWCAAEPYNNKYNNNYCAKVVANVLLYFEFSPFRTVIFHISLLSL